MSEQRPRVIGWFVDEDERATPLLLAMGRVVTAVAGLEWHLKLELARFVTERVAAEGLADQAQHNKLDKELASLRKLTGGKALNKLRKFGLPTDLDERISGVIDRRNRFVHHIMEDPVVMPAAVTGKGVGTAVAQLERLALDAMELAVELHVFAADKLTALFGTTRATMIEDLLQVNPATVADPNERALLEMIQAVSADVDLTDLPFEGTAPPS
jgi:hypothetical protein